MSDSQYIAEVEAAVKDALAHGAAMIERRELVSQMFAQATREMQAHMIRLRELLEMVQRGDEGKWWKGRG